MSFEEVTIDHQRLICGDALAVLPTLPSASVHLILVDPPYFRVKHDYLGEKLTWDRQWPTRDAYLAWLRQLAQEWQRLLTPNGSLYCFASPQMAAWVEVMLSELFTVLNHIVWCKHDGSGGGAGRHQQACKEDLMAFFPQSERIIFAEQYGAQYDDAAQVLHKAVYAPLGRYIQIERERAGASRNEVDIALGYISSANPQRGTSLCYRWEEGSSLPTRETYEKLRTYLNSRNGRTDYLRREYESLRREYESLRQEYEALRRPFTVSANVPYMDVWTTFPTVLTTPGKHPAEKPLPLLRHIILASSRPGDTILDCCAGSFSTLDAARQCGRTGIGIEQDRHWWQRGQRRLSQGDLWSLSVNGTTPFRATATQGKLL